MELAGNQRISSSNKEKITIPNCVHAVKPLLYSMDANKSRIGDIISTYDHIIDTASAKLHALENVVSCTTTPLSSIKTPPDDKTDPVTTVDNDLFKNKFSYKWPANIVYPIRIVVKVNADRIPVTPWLFRRMFGSHVHICLHKHSSFKGQLPNLVNDNDQEFRLNEAKLIFTVVVYDIERLEFVVDPLRQGTLQDEHNLQRYLLRLVRICAPLDPIGNAISESFVDSIGRDLLQKASQVAVKNTLSSIEVIVKSKPLLVHSSKPSLADFCLLTATYKHCLKEFPAIQCWKKQLELYFGLEHSEQQWFKKND